MEPEKEIFEESDCQRTARRQFLRFFLLSPLLGSAGLMDPWSIFTKTTFARDGVSTATMIDEVHPSYDSPFPSGKYPLVHCSDATNVFQFNHYGEHPILK